VFESAKCTSCGACREACPFGAVFWDADRQEPLICVYCGYCAKYCAYDVIEHEESEEVGHAHG